jgi:hypothetical protein
MAQRSLRYYRRTQMDNTLILAAEMLLSGSKQFIQQKSSNGISARLYSRRVVNSQAVSKKRRADQHACQAAMIFARRAAWLIAERRTSGQYLDVERNDTSGSQDYGASARTAWMGN